MKKEIAEKWIAALESGEYEQGQGSLRKDGKFCCLGVLCEVAIQEGVEVTVTHNSEIDKYYYEGNGAVLPETVLDWADMYSVWGRFGDGDDLADLNDAGVSFADIANVIRENVEKL